MIQQKGILKLLALNYSVQYKQGITNTITDALT